MGLLNKFRTNEKKKSLKEEVVEHLIDFLNTKKNLGIFPLDFGIDSYEYLNSGNQVIKQMMSDMKSGLEKYEKRVNNIEIEPISKENCFLLAFRITCKIEQISYSFQLSFHQQNKSFNIEESA